MNDRRPPLAGVRVLAQGLVWAGPFGTMILADLGAEVIEIESIQHLNPTRTQLRHIPDVVMQGIGGARYLNRDGSEGFWDRVTIFNYAKRGHLSATFDLRSERGHELFLELVRKADVFLENNAAEVVEHLGIGWEALHAANPRLIMVRFPGFGITGPYAHYKGYGLQMEGVAGHTMVRGYPDSDPSTTPSSLHGDPNAGAHVAWAVQAALLARERPARGSWWRCRSLRRCCTTSRSTCLTTNSTAARAARAATTTPRTRRTASSPALARTGGSRSPASPTRRSRRLCGTWIPPGSPTTSDSARRSPGCATARRSTSWSPRGPAATPPGTSSAGCRAAVWPPPRWRTSRRCTPTSIWPRAASSTRSPTRRPAPICTRGRWGKLQDTADVPPFRPAPTLGEHNEYVYKEIIGLSDEQYQSLVDAQIIGTVYLETAHA